MPWAVYTSMLPVFREDEPPMSDVTRNGALLTRSLGGQAFLRASLTSREVLLDSVERTGTTPQGFGGASRFLSRGRVAKQTSSRG